MVVRGTQMGLQTTSLQIAAVLGERDLLRTQGQDRNVDLRFRVEALRGQRTLPAGVYLDQGAKQRALRSIDLLARQLEKPRNDTAQLGDFDVGRLLALAYPDRVAKNRGGGTGGFVLANGRGGNLDPASALSREPFLAVAELTGAAAHGRIVLAAPLDLDEIEALFAEKITERRQVSFDRVSASLRARRTRSLGAITLNEQTLPVEAGDDNAKILADGILSLGLDKLPWGKSLQQWRERVMFLRAAEGEEWPDLSDGGLTRSADEWLLPLAAGKIGRGDIGADALGSAVTALIRWALRKRLDAEAPTHFTAPSGSAVPIDYAAPEGPKVAIRVQELFGLAQHPAIAAGRVPLVLELLSPAHRPVQITRDLPGFWRGSYADVRTEMKGRYPRHPWPDDPLAAPATRRAKPRGT
jgi:ATP-dependent helicase HrpB